MGFSAHPVCALSGNGTLGQLILQLHLKLCAVEAALALTLGGCPGNVELAPLLFGGVSYLVGHESGGREDELERLDRLQLAFQGLIGVDGETRCGYF